MPERPVPRFLGGLVLLSIILATGCKPTCQKVPSRSEIEADTVEDFEEKLDSVDATRAQRGKILALVRSTLPFTDKLQAQTDSRRRAIIAELKLSEPDRHKLGAMITKNLDLRAEYAHAMVDVSIQGHAVLSSQQRRILAAEESKPAEGFEGSWMLDRAIDYFLSEIDATPAQRRLLERIMKNIFREGRELRKRADALRKESAREWAKDKPDTKKIHAATEARSKVSRAMLFDLTGYYLLLRSKLDARQRRLLNAQMVRFEPCGEAGGKKAGSSGPPEPRRGAVGKGGESTDSPKPRRGATLQSRPLAPSQGSRGGPSRGARPPPEG